MAKKIAKWTDDAGNEHDTKRDADAADTRIAIHTWAVASGVESDGVYRVTAENIEEHAEDLSALLARYIRLSKPKGEG